MTPEQFKSLHDGDIVRHIDGANRYLVSGNYGTHVSAVNVMDIANPSEWGLPNLHSLDVGNIVTYERSKQCYVITGIHTAGSSYPHATAVATVEITRPEEWDLIFKSHHTRVKD
jgi:hypothetical protein